ncbi:hypothetical protein C8R47DRAFT_1238702 [Mycena vitilis]|nr:hypothetical protein C8R47DRAFT_1238702 [Mycena vitilis]
MAPRVRLVRCLRLSRHSRFADHASHPESPRKALEICYCILSATLNTLLGSPSVYSETIPKSLSVISALTENWDRPPHHNGQSDLGRLSTQFSPTKWVTTSRPRERTQFRIYIFHPDGNQSGSQSLPVASQGTTCVATIPKFGRPQKSKVIMDSWTGTVYYAIWDIRA